MGTIEVRGKTLHHSQKIRQNPRRWKTGVPKSAAESNVFPILQPLISKPHVSFFDDKWVTADGVWETGNADAAVT